MDIDKERAEFEKWLGTCTSVREQHSWAAWQARSQLSLSKPVNGYVLVPSDPTAEMVKAHIEFMDKAAYLHHPLVPYEGTANGDDEKKWYVRFITAAYKAMINASPKPIDADKDE